MAEIKDLSTTDANNNGTAANAGFPEGMAYSAVNDAARALEGMIARWYKDGNGTLTTGGSGNAYTLTPNRTISAYADGDTFLIEANHTNTGAATLNVSSLGAKSIVNQDGSALVSGAITSGGRYFVSYDGTNFQLIGASVSSQRLADIAALTPTEDNIIVGNGTTWVAEQYATARNSLGAAGYSDNNTFNGSNVFDGSTTFNGAVNLTSSFEIESTDAGAAAAPTVSLYRNSVSPAAADGIGQVVFYGKDSGGVQETYARIVGNIEDPTATSEDGSIIFQTEVAGTLATRMKIAQGVIVGSPTGGDKGIGTINAVGVYDDNVLLTDYVFDAAVEGQIDAAKWDAKVPNRVRDNGQPEVRAHEPARRFSARLDDLDPKAYGQKWKASRRLPAFDHKAGEQLSVGEYAQRLLETCEVQAIHIDKLLERIEALEARVNGRPN